MRDVVAQLVGAAERYVKAGEAWGEEHLCNPRFDSEDADRSAKADLELMDARDALRTLLTSPEVRQAMGQEAGEREAAIAKVIEGFEVGVFVRDISRDHETGWAVRLLPYIAALGELVAPEGPRGAAERREGDSDGPLRGGEAGTA